MVLALEQGKWVNKYTQIGAFNNDYNNFLNTKREKRKEERGGPDVK